MRGEGVVADGGGGSSGNSRERAPETTGRQTDGTDKAKEEETKGEDVRNVEASWAAMGRGWVYHGSQRCGTGRACDMIISWTHETISIETDASAGERVVETSVGWFGL